MIEQTPVNKQVSAIEVTKFNTAHYPVIVKELAMIKTQIAHLPLYYKSEIIISFYKNHSLQSDWITTNPLLAALITSGVLKSQHVEDLFSASKGSKDFLREFETYIKGSFNSLS